MSTAVFYVDNMENTGKNYQYGFVLKDNEALGAKLRIEKLKNVREWFIKNEAINFGSPTENLIRSWVVPNGFMNNKEVQKTW